MKLKLSVLFIWLVSQNIIAQQGDNSPYSRIGLGDLKPEAFVFSQQMGHTYSAFLDQYQINIGNPASYASLNVTSFDLGINAKRATLTQDDQSYNGWSGSFDYISLAFPLTNSINDLFERVKRDLRFGMGLTLRSVSSTSYNITTSEYQDGIGSFQRNYRGNGGTYEFMWGNAVKYKQYSFGVNLGYLFGKMEYDRNLFFPDNANAYINTFSNEYNISGFRMKLGLAYNLVLNKKKLEEGKSKHTNKLVFGLNYGLGTTANTNLTESVITVRQGVGNAIESDTSSFDNIEGKLYIPSNLGVGISYFNGEKFALSFDVSTGDWSKYYNEASKEVKGNLKNSLNVSTGGYYRPDLKSYKFRNRIFYRYGIFYQKDGRVINDKQLEQYGLTGGFGLPFIFQRKISHASLGFEIGKKGINTPIQEKYFKITFGATFNDDEWFLKRKYD